MGRPLDELYLEWLYDQVGAVGTDPSTGHWELLKILATKEFVWIVPNDDNRAEDGRFLRHEFLSEQNLKLDDPHWMRLGCDMFELLVGISRRLAFEGDGEPREWFWEMINNLGLYNYRDGGHIPVGTINEVLDDLIWRTYEPDGRGGLFPLKYPEQDQRDVEIWYQLNAYLLERE